MKPNTNSFFTSFYHIIIFLLLIFLGCNYSNAPANKINTQETEINLKAFHNNLIKIANNYIPRSLDIENDTLLSFINCNRCYFIIHDSIIYTTFLYTLEKHLQFICERDNGDIGNLGMLLGDDLGNIMINYILAYNNFNYFNFEELLARKVDWLHPNKIIRIADKIDKYKYNNFDGIHKYLLKNCYKDSLEEW